MKNVFGTIRHVIRRPRLLTSGVVAAALFVLLLPSLPAVRALLVAFNVGAALFLGLMFVLMFRSTTSTMKKRACVQDENKWSVLVGCLCIAAVVLLALSNELHAAKDKSIGDIALASSTIFLAWLFVAIIFAQQYAHSYYLREGQLAFPGTSEPDYLDFTYFAIVLSMCCQTSDVAITSSAFRRVVMLHSVISFFFNVIIIAITVNVVAGVL